MAQFTLINLNATEPVPADAVKIIIAKKHSATSNSPAVSFVDENGDTVATLFPFPGLLIEKSFLDE